MESGGSGGGVKWTQPSRLNRTTPISKTPIIVDGSQDFGFGCNRVRERDIEGSGRTKENPRLKKFILC